MNQKGTTSDSTVTLRIKSSGRDVNENVSITAKKSTSIKALKAIVINALGDHCKGRYVRLISNGRLLAPDSSVLGDFSVQDGGVLHAVIAAEGVRGGQQAELSRGPLKKRGKLVRGSGIGIGSNGIVIDTNSDENDDIDLEENRQLLGFDRLRGHGMSRSEVTSLRAYFSRQVDRYISQRNESRESGATNQSSSDSSDEPHLERLRMEDEWMELQGPHSEFRLNLNASNPLLTNRLNLRSLSMDDTTTNRTTERTPMGTEHDFIRGFILGYLFGVLMTFYLWIPAVPQRQKLGIMTGLLVQVGFSVLRDSGEV